MSLCFPLVLLLSVFSSLLTQWPAMPCQSRQCECLLVCLWYVIVHCPISQSNNATEHYYYQLPSVKNSCSQQNVGDFVLLAPAEFHHCFQLLRRRETIVSRYSGEQVLGSTPVFSCYGGQKQLSANTQYNMWVSLLFFMILLFAFAFAFAFAYLRHVSANTYGA